MRVMKSMMMVENLLLRNINRFFYKKQRQIRALLFAALIFSAFHTIIHNKLDHIHDSSCSVYVLEQLYFSADVVTVLPLPTIFLPFLFLHFQLRAYCFTVQKHFSIRAPPCC